MAKETIKVYNALNRPKGKTVSTGKGLTEQSHKKQCDMNYILKDYRRTGLLKHAAKHKGRYDDIPAVDFQQAMFIVTEANNMFEGLPADIRKRFENDPGKFLAFVEDGKNVEEMKKLGMIKGVDGLDVSGAMVNQKAYEETERVKEAATKTKEDETK